MQAIREVILIYATDLSTLVPSALFNKEKLSEYLKFNAKILPQDFIAYDEITPHEIVNIHIPYININNYFFDLYGNFSYYHSTTVLLKKLLDSEKYKTATTAYIVVFKKHFTLLILKNGKPLLVNNYFYETAEDFIYYILFTFEQLEINTNDISTKVLGAIDDEDAVFTILYKYIRNIAFYNDPLTATYKTDENDEPHKNVLLKHFI